MSGTTQSLTSQYAALKSQIDALTGPIAQYESQYPGEGTPDTDAASVTWLQQSTSYLDQEIPLAAAELTYDQAVEKAEGIQEAPDAPAIPSNPVTYLRAVPGAIQEVLSVSIPATVSSGLASQGAGEAPVTYLSGLLSALLPPPTLPTPSSLSLTVPDSVTIGVNQISSINGIKLSATGTSPSDTFTVTLTDKNGDLELPGTVGTGTNSLNVSGTLDQVNSSLGSIIDSDSVGGPDTITVTASNSTGDQAAAAFSVTANGVPVINVPPAFPPINLENGIETTIPGISLSETGNTDNVLFDVTISDISGALSIPNEPFNVSGSGTNQLTIEHASLTTVNGLLASLTDTASGSDTITITATDDLDNAAKPATITINSQPQVPVPPDNGKTPTPLTPGQAVVVDSLNAATSSFADELENIAGAVGPPFSGVISLIGLAAKVVPGALALTFIAGYNVGADLINEGKALAAGQDTQPFANQVFTDLGEFIYDALGGSILSTIGPQNQNPLPNPAAPLENYVVSTVQQFGADTQFTIGLGIEAYFDHKEQQLLNSLPPGTLPPGASLHP